MNTHIITPFKRPKKFDIREIEALINAPGTDEETEEVQPVQPVQPVQTPIITSTNLSGFIYVPSIDLHIAKQKSHLGLNWNNTHIELAKQGCLMPTIYQFREFLKYLKTDYQRTNKQEAEQILDEILTVRTPWRAEWLDAYFEQRTDGLYILTENKSKPEKLDSCLMSDKLPGIDLESWINGNNVNSQAIPNSKMKKGNLYYWYPRDGRVARFIAFSGRVILYCDWDPQVSNSSLGVRLARRVSAEAAQKK